jgi:cytoskeletal protein CcmA (bactofilin family)
MWKRNESSESPEQTRTTGDTNQTRVSQQPAAPAPPAPAASPTTGSARRGQSVAITGEITGSENLTIEGRVDGTVESRQHTVVIGHQATVKAQVFAKEVVVFGKVIGNITATTKVEIHENGTVEGDLTSPSVAIAEGATFRGSIDMTRDSAEDAA